MFEWVGPRNGTVANENLLTSTQLDPTNNSDNGWVERYSYYDQVWRAHHTQFDVEAAWTAVAQAAIGRGIHDATVYSIALSPVDNVVVNGVTLAAIDPHTLRQMANKQASGAAFDSTTRQGEYYRITAGSQLEGVFTEIAQKIAVRLNR
jgi:hypothetical protein